MSKKINFYAPVHFEPWDYRNPDNPGIGGSETQVVEMSWRLARRGYNVTVYAPVSDDCETFWRDTAWLHYGHVDPSEEAIWILSRCPWAVAEHDFNGKVWVVMQDEDCVGVSPVHPWKPELVEKMDRILPLCPAHARHLQADHDLPLEKLFLSTNGVRVDLFEEIEENGVPDRDYNRAIYASSPDRGMVQAVLPYWHRVRELTGDAELDIYYGWDNIETAIAEDKASPWMIRLRDQFLRTKDRPGINWHGRIGQPELYRQWLSHGVWPYWTSFRETSCIACMEAQAGGAIPITRPLWALAHNIDYGAVVDGNPWEDSRALASMVNYTARFIREAAGMDEYRKAMMLNARYRFDWERVVDQYQCWIEGAEGLAWDNPEALFLATPHHVFQRMEAKGHGTILNVACGTDDAGLKNEGAWNVDCVDESPDSGRAHPVDEIVDACALPYPDNSWDVVVLGEIIEHCVDREARQIVAEARRVARKRVVITTPQEDRSVEQQVEDSLAAGSKPGIDPYDRYDGGCTFAHINRWTLEKLKQNFGEPTIYRPLRNLFGKGHGLVYA